jgi:DNA polymerase/3'-5' exonuclease PolX
MPPKKVTEGGSGGGERKSTPKKAGGKVDASELTSDVNLVRVMGFAGSWDWQRGVEGCGWCLQNPEITEQLLVISKKYQADGDRWKSLGYAKAANSVKKYVRKITSKAEALRLPDVGESIATKIGEILEKVRTEERAGKGRACSARTRWEGERARTGVQGETAMFRAALEDPAEIARRDLQRIHGVGPQRAGQLLAAGLRSVADVQRHLSSGGATPAGMDEGGVFWTKHIEGIEKPIRAKEVSVWCELLADVGADQGALVVPAGAVRRGHIPCGALDFVLTSESFHWTEAEMRSLARSKKETVSALPTLVQGLESRGAYVHKLSIHNTRAQLLVTLPPDAADRVFGPTGRVRAADVAQRLRSAAAASTEPKAEDKVEEEQEEHEEEDEEVEPAAKRPTTEAAAAALAPLPAMGIVAPRLADLEDEEDTAAKPRTSAAAAAGGAGAAGGGGGGTAPKPKPTTGPRTLTSFFSAAATGAAAAPPRAPAAAAPPAAGATGEAKITEAHGGELRFLRIQLTPWEFRVATLMVETCSDQDAFLSTLRAAARKSGYMMSMFGPQKIITKKSASRDEADDGDDGGDDAAPTRKRNRDDVESFEEPVSVGSEAEVFDMFGLDPTPRHKWGQPYVLGTLAAQKALSAEANEAAPTTDHSKHDYFAAEPRRAAKTTLSAGASASSSSSSSPAKSKTPPTAHSKSKTVIADDDDDD